MKLSEISKAEFKGKLSGKVKTCPACKGKGHRAGDSEPSDDDFCAVCAGTGQVATQALKDCPDCEGVGHYADGDEPMDDEWCYTCAGTGEVGPGGMPLFNPDIDGDMTPPPDPAYLKAQQTARANQPELSTGEQAFKDKFGPLTHMSPNDLFDGKRLTQDQKWAYKRFYRTVAQFDVPKGFKMQSAAVRGDDTAILKVGFYTDVRKATNRQLLAAIKQWMVKSDMPLPSKRRIAKHGQSRYIALLYDETFDSGLDLSKTKF